MLIDAHDGITVRGLHRSFGAVHALAGVDLDARPGRVTALIGPNGSGKTTLLLVLAGLLVPHAGHVRVGGFDPVTDGPRARARIGWMPDTFGTWDSLTAREVLLTFAAAYRLPRAAAEARVSELLETVHLSEFADRPASVLSRGQKQRLGLARALVHSPDVLLLDEPASGLDPRSRVDLRLLLRSLAAGGTTVLVSSHVLSELDELVDDAVFLSLDRRVERIEGAGIPTVPVVHSGPLRREELAALMGPSRFDSRFDNPLTGRPDALMEGLYLRTERAGVVTGRAKVVRPEFVEKVKQSEHWQHQPLVPNRLRPGADIWS